MSITKAKYHAPVRSSRDAPEPVELAFERVEKESTGASASRFSTILATDLKCFSHGTALWLKRKKRLPQHAHIPQRDNFNTLYDKQFCC